MADAKGRVTLEEMTKAVLECHMDGHWWQWTHDDQITRRGKRILAFRRWHRCARCKKAVRWQQIEGSSWVVTRSYRIYNGYLHKGGRLHRAEAREEYYKRFGA